MITIHHYAADYPNSPPPYSTMINGPLSYARMHGEGDDWAFVESGIMQGDGAGTIRTWAR